jgi:hypothetical protein
VPPQSKICRKRIFIWGDFKRILAIAVKADALGGIMPGFFQKNSIFMQPKHFLIR